MSEAFLGIDLGATEVKAGLVDRDGRLLALGRAGYGLAVGHGPGWAEQDPGAWWSAVVSAVRALRPSEPVEVVAIGVDGHGPTLAAVDARGEATRPAITFLDTRSAAEAAELEAATGLRGWALGPLPAALWVERHEPAIAAATRWYLDDLGVAGLPPDRGSRRAAASRTRPCRMRPSSRRRPGFRWTADQPRRRWAPWSVGSPRRPPMRSAWRAGIPVAGGTNDAFASYLGAGLLRARRRLRSGRLGRRVRRLLGPAGRGSRARS